MLLAEAMVAAPWRPPALLLEMQPCDVQSTTQRAPGAPSGRVDMYLTGM
jgi:hypothetical protein